MPSYKTHAVLSRNKTPHQTLWSRRSKNRSKRQISSNTQLTLTCRNEKHYWKHNLTTLTVPRKTISSSNLATINWFHSLPSQRFQVLLTLFPKSFSPFPHGTCLLSVSGQYLALEEDYLPFSAPLPKYATLNTAPSALIPNGTGFSPSLIHSSKKNYIWIKAGNGYQDYNSPKRFTSWAIPGSFAITEGIIFIFFSSAYLYA